MLLAGAHAKAPGFAESNLAWLPPEAGTDFWFSPGVTRCRQGTSSHFISLDTSGSKLPNTGYLSLLPGQRLARPRTFSHFIILPFGPLPRVNTGQTRFCSGIKRGLVPFYRAPQNPPPGSHQFPVRQEENRRRHKHPKSARGSPVLRRSKERSDEPRPTSGLPGWWLGIRALTDQQLPGKSSPEQRMVELMQERRINCVTEKEVQKRERP